MAAAPRFSMNCTCSEEEKKKIWMHGGKNEFQHKAFEMPFLCTTKFNECIGWCCPYCMFVCLGSDAMARLDGNTSWVPHDSFYFSDPAGLIEKSSNYRMEQLLFCCCPACMLCLLRAKLRTKYDLNEHGFLGDCLLTWCCPCCSMHQAHHEILFRTGATSAAPAAQAMA